MVGLAFVRVAIALLMGSGLSGSVERIEGRDGMGRWEWAGRSFGKKHTLHAYERVSKPLHRYNGGYLLVSAISKPLHRGRCSGLVLPKNSQKAAGVAV